MKTSLVALLLALSTVASSQSAAPAQTPAAPAQTAPAQTSPSQPQQQKKEIKDPAEYNAYVGAVQQTDPGAKISGLEAFLISIPTA